jgi:hypothetical protein
MKKTGGRRSLPIAKESFEIMKLQQVAQKRYDAYMS